MSDASKMAAAPPDGRSDTSTASSHGDSDVVTAACGSGPSSSLDRFQWAENEDKLQDFDNVDKLPCVGRIEEWGAPCADGQRRGLAPGLKIYAGQPLLMFSRVKKRQAVARTIYRDNSGVYLEIGQTVIVPDDYTGECTMLWWVLIHRVITGTKGNKNFSAFCKVSSIYFCNKSYACGTTSLFIFKI